MDRHPLRVTVSALLPPLLYCGMIFLLSALESPNLPGPDLPFRDKLLHALLYAPLAVLFNRMLHRLEWPRTAVARIWISILLTGLYGVGDEIHQAFVPGRTPSPADVVADFTGALAGAWGYEAVRKKRIPAVLAISGLTKWRYFFKNR
jgi:VanZ family protein